MPALSVAHHTHQRWTIAYTLQGQWNWLLALAFFLGKIGAGWFAVSLIAGLWSGVLGGLVVAVAGKGTAHMLYLGRPLRALGMLRQVRTSWISRGLWAMAVMAVAGVIYLLLDPRDSGGLRLVVTVAALTSALFIMTYDGLVLYASRGMQVWRSAVLPILCLSYSVLGGVSLAALTVVLSTADHDLLRWVEISKVVIIVANLVIVGSYVLTLSDAPPAGRKSLDLLLGEHPVGFFGGVIGVGLVLTLILAVLWGMQGNLPALVALALADMVGHYLIFYLLMRVAVYAPILQPAAAGFRSWV